MRYSPSSGQKIGIHKLYCLNLHRDNVYSFFDIYIMMVAQGHETHFYYQMPLVPILCIYAGTGVNYLLDFDLFKDSFLKHRISTKTALSILFILMTIIGIVRSKHYLSFNLNRLKYAKRIEQLTKKGSLVIFGGWKKGKHPQIQYPPRDPIAFYFSHRKN
jgi:hypothetical protein